MQQCLMGCWGKTDSSDVLFLSLSLSGWFNFRETQIHWTDQSPGNWLIFRRGGGSTDLFVLSWTELIPYNKNNVVNK